MTLETTDFDVAKYLEADANVADYLKEAFETGEREYIAHALGVAARAKGMTKVAKESGVSRETLYRALSKNGNPQLETVLSVLSALGVSLTTKAV